MPFIIMREGATTTWFKRQPRLRAIQGLNLALFIHTEDYGILWRGHIHAYDISELLQKFWIPRELETLGQMRLELVLLPNTLDRILAHTLCAGQRASTPMRASLRLGLQRRLDNASHCLSPVLGFSSPS